MWHAVEGSSEKGWLDADGKLIIDPAREKFLDYSKKLIDEGLCNDTSDWTEAWFADMAGTGPKGCFGFFGPAWLINYTMGENCGAWIPTGEKDADGKDIKKLDKTKGTYGDWAVCTSPVGFFWGGTWVLANKDTDKAALCGDIIKYITLDTTKDGIQYKFANGLLNDAGTKDTVASETVTAISDGTVEFLGGQNMLDVFGPAQAYATSKNKTESDEDINSVWRDQVRQYAHGDKSRDQAIADFKQTVADKYGIEAA